MALIVVFFKRYLKSILAILTFLSLLTLFTWKGALILMGVIACHELGHVLALKTLGLSNKGFYFIPFFGGVTVPNELHKAQLTFAIAAYSGPLAGFLQALVLFILYKLTGNLFVADLALVVAGFNAFNMLPITPFDGGQIIRAINYSINPWFAKIFSCILFLIGLFFAWKLSIVTLIFYASLGLFDLIIDLYLRDRYKIDRPIKMKTKEVLLILITYLTLSYGLANITLALIKGPDFNKVDSLQIK